MFIRAYRKKCFNTSSYTTGRKRHYRRGVVLECVNIARPEFILDLHRRLKPFLCSGKNQMEMVLDLDTKDKRHGRSDFLDTS
jgi:hypothetical protein